jgi:hypothetical protein
MEFPYRGWYLSAALAFLRHGRLLVLGDFPRAELRDACNQLHGDGLGEREADRAFADLIRGKVVSECLDDLIRRGVERVVLLPPSEIEHGTTVQFVRGDLVTDHFLGGGHGLADGAADAL